MVSAPGSILRKEEEEEEEEEIKVPYTVLPLTYRLIANSSGVSSTYVFVSGFCCGCSCGPARSEPWPCHRLPF